MPACWLELPRVVVSEPVSWPTMADSWISRALLFIFAIAGSPPVLNVDIVRVVPSSEPAGPASIPGPPITVALFALRGLLIMTLERALALRESLLPSMKVFFRPHQFRVALHTGFAEHHRHLLHACVLAPR
jgi:hypothetical protein